MRSRQPVRVDEWVSVVAERKGWDGLLTVDQEEPVTGRSTDARKDTHF